MKNLTFAALAASALSAHGMTIAQFNPLNPPFTLYAANNTPTPVYFDLGTPVNPTGTSFFTVAITNSLADDLPFGQPAWALTGGIPGRPTGTTILQSSLSPSIISALDTTLGLDVLAFKGGAGATVDITLNFSNLPGGYLPAGSLLAYTDVDFAETTQIVGNTTWFNPGAINPGAIIPGDVTNGVITGTGEPDTTPADFTLFSGDGTTLTLTGAAAATDSPGVLIPVIANLTSLTITAKNTTNPSAAFYQGFSIAAIPEPGTGVLTLATSLLLLRRNRRAHPLDNA